MIQKLGNALKTMARRSMLRGNRGDAEAIHNFGMTGMRSNLKSQPQNTITQNRGIRQVSNVKIQETQRNLGSQISAAINQNSQNKNL